MTPSDHGKSLNSSYLWREGERGFCRSWKVVLPELSCHYRRHLIIIHYAIHGFAWLSVSMFHFIIKSFFKKLWGCDCLDKNEFILKNGPVWGQVDLCEVKWTSHTEEIFWQDALCASTLVISEQYDLGWFLAFMSVLP